LGAYGTSALVLDLLLKVGAAGALVQSARTVPAIVGAAALARAAGVVVAALVPYARSQETLAGRFAGGVDRGIATVAVLTACAIAALATGIVGVWQALAVALASLVVVSVLVRRVGGVTGDVLGAVIEVGETCALLVAALVTGAGSA
ncbi:MAG TPA: adenosylcobinamide-GDP ribazoletransferase, partial [Solirubrobacteraceae bacterium]|nr:adenosylcobinamide-GDP ribazoletransferase [Solirubrobacteraceae bacterium]